MRRNADRPSDRHPPRHEPGFGVTSGSHMRLMIIEKGSVNAAVFIAFQKCLIAGAKRTIFRIVDRAPRIAPRKPPRADDRPNEIALAVLSLDPDANLRDRRRVDRAGGGIPARIGCHMRLMIIEKGSVNAAVFLAFLKCLIAGAKRTIFLIVDRGPAHHGNAGRELALVLSAALCPRPQPRRVGGETSRSGRPHGDHRPGRLQGQGSIVDAPTAKRPRKIRSFDRNPPLKCAA